MPRVPLPPNGPILDGMCAVCVANDGVDFLQFDPVQDAGYLIHAPQGVFRPDIPDGHIDPGPSAKMYPTRTGNVYVAYFDSVTSQNWLLLVQVKDTCP